MSKAITAFAIIGFLSSIPLTLFFGGATVANLSNIYDSTVMFDADAKTMRTQDLIIIQGKERRASINAFTCGSWGFFSAIIGLQCLSIAVKASKNNKDN
jgi:hypothetical protein